MKLKLAVFFFVLWAGFSVFAAIPPAENLLPGDTLAMVTVPDWSALREAAAQSPEWLLWNDPAMKPFHDDFMVKFDERFVAPLEENPGIKISDYLPLLQGQVTFAVTRNGWDGTGKASPALLFLLDAKGHGDLLATNLAALKKEWMSAGRLIQTETLQDIKFSVLTLSSNTSLPFTSSSSQGASGSSSPNTLYIGQFQSLLIVGTSVKAVESVAAHLNGGANPSLSQNAQFAEDQLSQFHGAPLGYGWFNAKAFFMALSRTSPDADSASMWDSAIPGSGLQGLRSASFAFRESHEGLRLEFFAAVPESAREGIFKMIAPVPKDASPPLFVPADAVTFWRYRMDGQQAWTELQKSLAAISPGLLASLNSIMQVANAAAQQQDPNFDITKYLIDNLGDDWMRYQKAPAGNSLQDLNSAPWLFLFAANNPDQAALALKTVSGMMFSGSQPQTRDFLGRKIYSITLPPAHFPGGPPASTAAPSTIYCTASGGYVAVSTDPSMIEGYLRSDDAKPKPLSQAPGLVEAAQEVGGMGNGLFGYQNQRETARSLFGALRGNSSASPVTLNPLMPLAGREANLSDLMNFSLLPDYDKVSKYFNFSVYGGSATSKGLDLKIFSPRPPELN
jgi:hypothetical protein